MEGNEIFTFIGNNDFEGVQKFLSEHKLKGDLYDDHGMTPLQHAAYKGNKQICQLLLDHGADVNSGRHEHGYSALHFAALSGKDDVCACLLSAGAKTNATNSVGRTATQMAAFVGNHKCVAVINNYIGKSDVDYYIVPRGLETSPKLDAILSEPLHNFIMQVNIHPVRVALNLLPSLINHLPPVRKVVTLMSEKQMKAGPETNEIMSFKLHYLAFIIGEVQKCKQGDKECDLVELFVRKVHRPIHGEKYVEMFVRDCVREFPYRECMVFKQMVSSLSRSGGDSIPALSVLTTAINGHRGFADDTQPCATCAEESATKKCSKCKVVRYCDRECQRLHWFIHKKECARSNAVVSSSISCTTNGTSGETEQETSPTKQTSPANGNSTSKSEPTQGSENSQDTTTSPSSSEAALSSETKKEESQTSALPNQDQNRDSSKTISNSDNSSIEQEKLTEKVSNLVCT
uniref:Ankyrin repeat and MYND domain-containing protein 2 n=2 Tax=Cacopsylla melanoneura TaxID=428564 RepID=A0A8D8VIP2_9HEMI